MGDKDHIVSFLINNEWYNLAHLPLTKEDAIREAKDRIPSRVIMVSHEMKELKVRGMTTRLIPVTVHRTVKEYLNR